MSLYKIVNLKTGTTEDLHCKDTTENLKQIFQIWNCAVKNPIFLLHILEDVCTKINISNNLKEIGHINTHDRIRENISVTFLSIICLFYGAAYWNVRQSGRAMKEKSNINRYIYKK